MLLRSECLPMPMPVRPPALPLCALPAPKVGDQILEVNGRSFLGIPHDEAVRVLKSSHHLMMTVKDVGRLPHARTVVGETKWIASSQIAESSASGSVAGLSMDQGASASGKRNIFLDGKKTGGELGETAAAKRKESKGGKGEEETAAHLLSDTFVGPDSDSPGGVRHHSNNHPYPHRGSPAPPESSLLKPPLGHLQPPPPSITTTKARLSLERSFSAEEDQQKCVECALQPARVYTITGEHGMLGSNRGSKESLELEVLKGASTLVQPSTSPSSTSSSPTQHHLRHGHRSNTHRDDGSHRHGNPVASGSNHHTLTVTGGGATHHGHHGSHHHLSQQPLSSSVSAHNIRSWGEGGKGGSREDCSLNMALDSSGAPSRSQGSLDLESSREAGKQHRRLERMWSVDRMTGLEREDNSWDPKENMFSFQTATTTMQA
ncbi:unnamed protein product [Coregonus sp. 'balchen']|nr:unnamed protein product [Coregonus sp. 'balchen']